MKEKETTTKVAKWGNSYGIRLPLELAQSLSITEGSELLLKQDKDSIKIYRKQPSLDDVSLDIIFQGVNDKDIENKTDDFFGEKQGNEIW